MDSFETCDIGGALVSASAACAVAGPLLGESDPRVSDPSGGSIADCRGGRIQLRRDYGNP